MKNKVKALKSEQKTYYYNSQHGALQNKKRNKLQTLSVLATASFVFAVGNIAVDKYHDYQASRVAGVFQRQSASVDAEQKSDEPDDKRKNAVVKAREDDQLAKQVKDKLKNVPGGQKWSVYLRDLNSDRMASINADKEIDAAGLSNLFLVPVIEAKTPAANWGAKAGKQNLGKCIELMISSSDQECASAAARYADTKNLDNVVNSLGFKNTSLKDKKTTARETGDLLFRLQNNQLLSDKGRRVVFDGLYSQKQLEGVTAGCDAQCLIASANGENSTVRHEAAIVSSGKSKYVVVIMTQGATWSQIADVASAVRVALQP